MRQVHVNCTVDGCGLPHKARGLCNTHYAQLKRGVRPNQPIKQRDMHPAAECTVHGCGHPVKSKGLCHMHYARRLRHGFVKNPDRTKPFTACRYTACDSRVMCKGLCNLHYTHSRKMATYGITLEQYQQMLQAQGGSCAICGGQETSIDDRSGKPRMMAVDHDHATSKVRGILCSHCNRAIGLLGDSCNTVLSAYRYLNAAL